MSVPFTFANTPSGIPLLLAQLDDNFSYLAGTPTLSGLNVNGNTILNNLRVSGSLIINNVTISPTGITGTGNIVLSDNPVLSNPDIGTPVSGILSNCTGYDATNLVGIVPVIKGGTGLTTVGAAGQVLTSNGSNLYWGTGGGGGGGSGTVTSVAVSGGTSGLTTTGGPITTAGTITIGGTLSVSNGGTGLTAVGAAGQVLTSNGTNLYWSAGGGGGGSGTVTSVAISGGTTGLTSTGGPITTAGTITLSGTLSVANGGTGLTAVGTAGQVLTSNGTTLYWATGGGGGGSGTVTSVDVSGGSTGLITTGGPVTTSGSITIGGVLGVANGGTGATTQNAAISALLPAQSGRENEFLFTDGSNISWKSSSQVFNSIAELRAYLPSTATNQTVILSGYYSPSDGGGGEFSYSFGRPAGTYSDNSGTIIVPTGGNGSSAWIRNISGPINVRWFGAKGDGTTNDSPAISAAIASVGTSNGLCVPAGTYVTNSSLTFSQNVIIEFGAIFKVPTGIKLTFNNGIVAERYQIFSITGTGSVVFNEERQVVGYPEWWGAVVGGTDCYAAIIACMIACPVTELGVGDYYTASTIKMQKNGRTITGVGAGFSSKWGIASGRPANTSRILTNSSTIDIIQIGPDTGSGPNTGNNATVGLTLSHVSVVRNVAPSVSSACSCVKVQYTFFVNINYVDAWDSIYGFVYKDTCRTNVKNCISWRTLAGTGGTDTYQGHLFLNSNWSTYLTDSGSGCSISPAGAAVGIGFAGEATDTFLLRPEITGGKIGIFLNLNSNLNNIDIHISGAVVDQFSSKGLSIANAGTRSAISIVDGYFAPQGGYGTVGIDISGSYGSISLTNNQVIGFPTTGMVGMSLVNSWNIISSGNMFVECTGGGIYMSGCGLCNITDNCKNAQLTSSSAAITLTGATTRCSISPVINGFSGQWPVGVSLASSTSSNQVNTTTISTNVTTRVSNSGSGNQITGT